MTGAEFVRVNARVRRQQAQQQRFLGHFQAEDAHRQALPHRHVLRDIQRQRRFPHRRPRSNNNQLGRLQARSQIVELLVAGGDSGEAVALGEDAFQPWVAFLNQFLDADKSRADAVFRQLKNRGFRAVQQGVRVFLGFERGLLDVMRGMNQVAQQRLFFDDARVMLHVRDARHPVHQLRQIGVPAGAFQLPGPAHVFGQRYQVDGVVRLVEIDHPLENSPVPVMEKILRTDFFNSRVDGLIVEQDGAEDGALGLQVVRQGPFECKCSAHLSSPYVRFIGYRHHGVNSFVIKIL